MVRSRNFKRHFRPRILHPRKAAAELVREAPDPPSPGDDRNVEATMTKGDHMAAKHLSRTLRPAPAPAAVPLAPRTEQLL
ncbi:hypothetical protein ASG86_00395 [Arthrobacter sp. Soil764]|nr:hypothetical protein ASG86_00395 [Arthrobacter sp. Soil764]